MDAPDSRLIEFEELKKNIRGNCQPSRWKCGACSRWRGGDKSARKSLQRTRSKDRGSEVPQVGEEDRRPKKRGGGGERGLGWREEEEEEGEGNEAVQRVGGIQEDGFQDGNWDEEKL